MRKLTIAAVAAVATFSLSAQAAGAASRADASASAQARNAPQKVSGYYKLSDGNFVRVYSSNNKLFAQFDNGSRDELVAVTHTIYVGKASNVKLVFQHVPDGREYDVVMVAP